MPSKEELLKFIEDNKHYINSYKIVYFKNLKYYTLLQTMEMNIDFDHDTGYDKVCITYLDLKDKTNIYCYLEPNENLIDHFHSELAEILYLN